jgi:hypothetical protein
VVQFSALASELAGLLELAVALGQDLVLAAEELVARGDVADGAVQTSGRTSPTKAGQRTSAPVTDAQR